MVRERGLEPPPLTGPDPKSGASAISPLARRLFRTIYVVNRSWSLYSLQNWRHATQPQAIMALNPTHAVTDTPSSDNRKHPIRNLWRRNGSFVARKNVRWVPMAAQTVAEAQEEFRKLLVERSENGLRHIGRSPTNGPIGTSFRDERSSSEVPSCIGGSRHESEKADSFRSHRMTH